MFTCLWFDSNAEEAVEFYVSLFPASRIVDVTRYGEAGPGEAGTVLTITFELDGRRFMALNGGSVFHFTPAISMVATCETQAEIDRLWTALLDGGEVRQCGWLTDRFGLSWQIVPAALEKMLRNSIPERADRVMAALLKMVKLDIRGLEEAYGQQ